MGDFKQALDDKLVAFIQKQHLFFVASAPQHGRVNVSPKGMDTFRVFDFNSVAYLDLTGSGNETAAHIKENGRLTIMFCSFAKQPLILRLYGEGKIVRPSQQGWDQYSSLFPILPGQRQLIFLSIQSIQTSCGYAVPLYDHVAERDTLSKWAINKGESGIVEYWNKNNQTSIDQLPTGILDDT